MKNKDLFLLSFNMFYKSKRKRFYIIISTICVVLCLCMLHFSFIISNYMEDNYTKNIQFRTLLVNPKHDVKDLGEGELRALDHVVDVYSSKYQSFYPRVTSFNNDNYDGKIILLYGSHNIMPSVTYGRIFDKNEKNVAICPENFYPDSSAVNYKMDSNKIINGKDLVGTTFSINYYSYNEDFSIKKAYKKDFQIVGLYDNKSVMTFNNQCYISSDDIVEILDTEAPEEENKDIIVNYGWYVVVDDFKNIETVTNEILSSQFRNVGTAVMVNSNLIQSIQLIPLAILIIVLFVIFLLTTFYIRKKILNEKQIIGIMRASGYSNQLLKRLYIIQLIITHIFCFILGLIIFLALFFAVKILLLQAFEYMGMKLSISFGLILITLLITIVIPIIISYISVSHNLKLQIINLFEEK